MKGIRVQFMLGVEEDGIQTRWQAESGKMEEACFKESSRTIPALVWLVYGRSRPGQGYFVFRSWHMGYILGQ